MKSPLGVAKLRNSLLFLIMSRILAMLNKFFMPILVSMTKSWKKSSSLSEKRNMKLFHCCHTFSFQVSLILLLMYRTMKVRDISELLDLVRLTTNHLTISAEDFVTQFGWVSIQVFLSLCLKYLLPCGPGCAIGLNDYYCSDSCRNGELLAASCSKFNFSLLCYCNRRTEEC